MRSTTCNLSYFWPTPTTYYLLPTTYYLLLTTYYLLLPHTYYLPLERCGTLLATDYRLPTTYYLLPTTYHLLLPTYYWKVWNTLTGEELLTLEGHKNVSRK